MSKLILSDLHLKGNDLDSYRFKIFDVLVELCNKYGVKELIMLGDITEKKNNHEARLVNAIVDNINYLVESIRLSNLIILCGNHDYTDIANPFFKFLDSSLTNLCKIYFVTEPTKINEDLYIPHYYNDFKEISKKYSFCDNLFLHHSFNGVMLRSGSCEDKGNNVNDINNIKFNNCYSGHIHLAQTYKNIEYIGSPYATKFGDNNQGRVLLIKDGKKEYIRLPRFVHKIDVKLTNGEDIKKYDIEEGDQIKVEINLTLQNCHEYESSVTFIKKYIEGKKAILTSIQGKVTQDITKTEENIIKSNEKLNNNQIIERFCKSKQLPNNYFFIANDAMKGFVYNEN